MNFAKLSGKKCLDLERPLHGKLNFCLRQICSQGKSKSNLNNQNEQTRGKKEPQPLPQTKIQQKQKESEEKFKNKRLCGRKLQIE